jgi:outer membrane protein
MNMRFIGAFLAIILSGNLFAADNIAYVDLRYLFSKAPQLELINNALQSEFSERTESLKKLEDEIKKLQSDLQTNDMTYSAQQKTEIQRQIQAKGSDYQLQGKALQEDIKRRQSEENNKLLFVIRKAISKVAEDGKYDMVLSTEGLLHAKPTLNISDAVLKVISDPTFK